MRLLRFQTCASGTKIGDRSGARTEVEANSSDNSFFDRIFFATRPPPDEKRCSYWQSRLLIAKMIAALARERRTMSVENACRDCPAMFLARTCLQIILST
ncbi:MAG TPA: hypothetical protein VHC39_04440 [Rhizomicrobium sp.]|nr:hypothetical protein [Rhizomicrobium sp.]